MLYLGAIGDRYGRKLLLVMGVVLSVPACLVAAWAGSMEVLIGARLLGGLSAGMAYPTTLALIGNCALNGLFFSRPIEVRLPRTREGCECLALSAFGT